MIPDLSLLPLIGFATGTVSDGREFGRFTWVRVGLTTILAPETSESAAGVATFVPHPPFGTCEAPLPLTADVIGVAAIQ